MDGYLRLTMMHEVVSLVSLRNCTYFPLVTDFYTKFSHSFQHDQENRAYVEHNEIHFVMVSSFLPIFFIKLWKNVGYRLPRIKYVVGFYFRLSVSLKPLTGCIVKWGFFAIDYSFGYGNNPKFIVIWKNVCIALPSASLQVFKTESICL